MELEGGPLLDSKRNHQVDGAKFEKEKQIHGSWLGERGEGGEG